MIGYVRNVLSKTGGTDDHHRWTGARRVNRDTDQRLARVLVGFAHTLGTDFSIQKILDHLVLRIVEILPITGAGVMLMGPRDELHFIIMFP